MEANDTRLMIDIGDHPHGGGRGKSKGNRIPVSPWGQQVSLTKMII